jgi:hypothetical protein
MHTRGSSAALQHTAAAPARKELGFRLVF